MSDGHRDPLLELEAQRRKLRAETLGLNARLPGATGVVTRAAPAPQPDAAPPGAVQSPEPPAPSGERDPYAVDMASHRETSERLLEERDRAISRLESSVAELRAEFDMLRQGMGALD